MYKCEAAACSRTTGFVRVDNWGGSGPVVEWTGRAAQWIKGSEGDNLSAIVNNKND